MRLYTDEPLTLRCHSLSSTSECVVRRPRKISSISRSKPNRHSWSDSMFNDKNNNIYDSMNNNSWTGSELKLSTLRELNDDFYITQNASGSISNFPTEKKPGESRWSGLKRKISSSGQRQKKNIMAIFNDEDQSSNKGSSLTKENSNSSRFLRKGAMFSSAKDLSKTSLTEALTHYDHHGFDFELDATSYYDEDLADDTILEDSWTDVIDQKDGMLREDKIQQEAIWELIVTERNFLRKCRVIIKVFQNCLMNLQRENFLTEVDNQKLFSNISDVYDTNRTFWTKYLFPIIENARDTKEPIKPSQFNDSFAGFGDLFEPYIKYCLEESTCVKYHKHLKRTNEHFEEYLSWCENQEQCNRLKLSDLLVKPMQRVTKYGLLLRTIMNKTRDIEEKLAIENMINQVERFVTKINTTLRLKHEQQKLDAVLSRIELYYPVEAVNEDVERIILDYCNFDLRGKIPGLHEEEQRCILLEGPMKLTEKHGRIEVHAFLFTDILVLTKAKKGGDKLRIIRQPFRLNKVMIHPLKDLGSFVFIYLNEYNVLVTAFTLQVNSGEYAKWMQALDKAKSRYTKARAGQGSTLDFFDDDIFATPTYTSPSHFPDISPMPDRRSTTIIDDTPQSPSIVVTDDMMNLRSRSSIAISSDRSSLKSDQQAFEAPVKRSLSDPKPASWIRDKRSRSRPMSLISTSDRDTASWVLTNEKRHRSGSIPSDISEDSRRSSGIGDSFRSINSDSAVPLRENNQVLKPFASYPEVSNVTKLKARFETSDCPDTEEGSNSSTASPVIGISESLSASQCATSTTATPNTRRTTPPDFMENHSTIHEEEEQYSNNSYEKITEPSIPCVAPSEASSDSILTSSTVQHVEDSPYENLDSIRNSIKKSSRIAIKPEIKNFEERGTQCKLDLETISLDCETVPLSDNNVHRLDESLNYDVIEVQADLHETTNKTVDLCVCTNSNSHDVSHDDVSHDVIKKDVATQCLHTEDIHSDLQCKEVAIQCEVNHNTCNDTCNASTQCGDFIHLTGVSESDTDDVEFDKNVIEIIERPSSAPPSPSEGISSYNTPMLYMLNSSLQNLKQPRGILKHSYSEAHIPYLEELSPELSIIHNRSRSDEPRETSSSSPKQKHRNSTTTYDFPGMRALQTLSESLESSLQRRKNSGNSSRPIVKNYDDTKTESSMSESSRSTSPNSSKSMSPSLRRVALMNSSPSPLRKPEHDNELSNGNQERLTRSNSDISNDHHIVKSDRNESEGKRNTWHDFDSIAALERIERTKYGPEGRSDINSNSSDTVEGGSSFNRTLSQSTEQLDGPKKQGSFKKSILKKFSSANALETSDYVGSKSYKKQLKKEKDKLKKEKKQQEKDEKKKEKKEKSRKRSTSETSDLSSDNSRTSTSSKLKSIKETSNSF